MRIRYESWHYRFIAKSWDNEPRSLCAYFWKIVISILIGITGSVVALFMSWYLLKALSYPFLQHWMSTGYALVSFPLWLAIGIVASYNYRQWLYTTTRLERPDKPPSTPPGLVQSFLVAKYRRICPLLEYDQTKYRMDLLDKQENP